MIGKAKSISHISNAINYARNKIKAEEICRYRLVGETGTEIAKEFRVFQNLNARCQRNAFSFVLSPSREDGNRLTKSDFINIAETFLGYMNLSDNQSISFLHKDRQHTHLHIYVNRINTEGKATKDNYIGKKAQRVAERIAREMNLTVAREVQLAKENRLRRAIDMAHEKIWQQKPGNIFEYARLMQQEGVTTHLKQASNGKVVGMKFQVGEESIKASSVHRGLSAANLQKLIRQNSRTNRNRIKI
ncbi:relaxase/mobilization nuclease domain-containing protein [Gaoshiqia sediminis]|uniref:Relaxase/mobilization nuclease domain-containing protein n=1 Tax=Gaoshiqia sediminis TaxID=2986998 RepID=A0AA41Y8L2_9BACT|nr:relaxase/mobilization nuclease domain-containing protein [Gaoshiqia sediminis]MCW0481195.1 relaxase/mobilization nuclease domain-containing protein [Gaoshiqia sediminis]